MLRILRTFVLAEVSLRPPDGGIRGNRVRIPDSSRCCKRHRPQTRLEPLFPAGSGKASADRRESEDLPPRSNVRSCGETGPIVKHIYSFTMDYAQISIIKRDGKTEPFSLEKIVRAITKAYRAGGITDE